jgi:pyruvate dehydrogenase (quinone)
MDSARVIAITGLTFNDLIDTRFMQDVNTVELMKGVALYNTASAGHALVITDIACRSALGGRGVAHITAPKDVQAMKLSANKPSNGVSRPAHLVGLVAGCGGPRA